MAKLSRDDVTVHLSPALPARPDPFNREASHPRTGISKHAQETRTRHSHGPAGMCDILLVFVRLDVVAVHQ